MDVEQARRRFSVEVSRPEDDIDLAEVALLIAAEAQGGLDLPAERSRLAALATAAEPAVARGRSEVERLANLAHQLFGVDGLGGDDQDYYNPDNSYLNRVLDRRLGIPITLSIILIDIGRRLGLPLLGVSFPSHFLVTHEEHTDVLVDPFHRGRLLVESDCKDMLESMSDGRLSYRRAFTQPAPPREIVARLLNNLKSIHIRRRDVDSAISVVDRLLLLAPGEAREHRDRGLLHLSQDRFRRALADLEVYLAEAPDATDRLVIEARAAEAHAKLKSQN
jgi:regulator of sirC expression with transglutaminase-like and TPR domain